jgi:acylphosphatase
MIDRTIRARAIVRGRVQGVWFRQSTADEARALGVAGWVRNRPDGSVEAVFEGSPAEVTSVDVTREEPAGESGFAVRG